MAQIPPRYWMLIYILPLARLPPWYRMLSSSVSCSSPPLLPHFPHKSLLTSPPTYWPFGSLLNQSEGTLTKTHLHRVQTDYPIALDAPRGKEGTVPRASGSSMASQMSLSFNPLELWKNKCWLFEVSQFMVTCYSNHRKLIKYISVKVRLPLSILTVLSFLIRCR